MRQDRLRTGNTIPTGFPNDIELQPRPATSLSHRRQMCSGVRIVAEQQGTLCPWRQPVARREASHIHEIVYQLCSLGLDTVLYQPRYA